MNPIIALQTIVGSAKNHPWLLALATIALIAHACDLQWPDYHKLFSTIAYGLFSIAFLYAGGTSLPAKTDTQITVQTPTQTKTQ